MGKLKNTFLTLTAILAMNTALMAQSYRNINGTIKSIFDKKPASYVTVTIAEKNNPINTQTTRTDNQGRYNLLVTGIKDKENTETITGIETIAAEGTIEYALPKTAKTKITVFNILGQKIRELYNAEQSAGRHRLYWDKKNDAGARVSSGIYPYAIEQEEKFRAGKTSIVHKENPQTLERALQKQINARTEQQRLGKTTGRTEYTLTIEGANIWGWQTTFSTSQDTTIDQYIKDKTNMPASVMEKYNKLSKMDPTQKGNVRTLKPLTAHFVVDTLNAVQKQFYEIYKQKATLIQNAKINNLDTTYFKNKKFETGQEYPNTPNGMHQIGFGDAGGFAAATVVDFNTTTGIINRAATVYDQAYLKSENLTFGLYAMDVSLTKEVMTGETYFGRNDDPDYNGLFNSAVGNLGKDFKNPIDITMLQAHFMNPPNTKWDSTKQMEIAPSWQNYLNKSSGTATMIILTRHDGTTYTALSNKSLEQVMKDKYNP